LSFIIKIAYFKNWWQDNYGVW